MISLRVGLRLMSTINAELKESKWLKRDRLKRNPKKELLVGTRLKCRRC
jgi:hypothetical protein